MNVAAPDGGPVLVFDSGIGGLSVLGELQMALPDRAFVYVADEAAFPYGAWEEQALIDRIVALIGQLIGTYSPALVVIACNTASTLVLAPLRARYSIPFVGTVPAIKPAAAQTRSGLISVLATPGTMKRDYTRDLIEHYARSSYVRLVGAPDLAAIAEAEMHGIPAADEAIRQQIAPCFATAGDKRTDIVVLACTHYPFLIDRFKALQPWPVSYLDPAPAIARRAASLIGPAGEAGLENLWLTTGDSVEPSLLPVIGRYGLNRPTAIDFAAPSP